MSSSTSVTIDYVLKQMREKDRKIFYVEDADGSTLAYSDNPELKIDAVCDKLEAELSEINGTYAYVRLHHKGGGANKQGGKQEPLLRYKVYIGGNGRGNERGSREKDSGLAGMGGSLGLFQQFFTKIADLEKQIAISQEKAETERWKRIAEERRENSHEAPIDLLLTKGFKKYMQYEAGKEAGSAGVAGAKTPLADDGGKKHEAETETMLGILKNFQAIDENYLTNLERVSKYAKANPEAYFGLLTSLKQNGF